MYRNIGAAFTHLTQALRVPASHVVLYGQSIGSAPTCQVGLARLKSPLHFKGPVEIPIAF
jgi:hypothetical protein